MIESWLVDFSNILLMFLSYLLTRQVPKVLTKQKKLLKKILAESSFLGVLLAQSSYQESELLSGDTLY